MLWHGFNRLVLASDECTGNSTECQTEAAEESGCDINKGTFCVLLSVLAHPLHMSQRLRADEVTETDQRDSYQENATEKTNGLYVVPRVVE